MTIDRVMEWVNWWLTPRAGDATVPGIISWWEARRWGYNLALVLVGLVLAGWVALVRRSRNDDGGILSYFVFILLLLIVPANLWYVFGWMMEAVALTLFGYDLSAYGPIILGAATIFSILFVFVVVFVLFLI